MSDLTPITREEALLDGADLEPITRKEQFIKRIYDKTQEIPEPITREEWFLKKAGEGTSPVTIEQLNVTENGTYSEQGKAYSPVIVEVPAPTLITKTITENGTYNASEDNADGYSQVTVNVPYMEKKSASGDIASFSDGAGYPFLKVKANINPVQDLHGYEYPWVEGAGKNKLPNALNGGVEYIEYSNVRLAVSGDKFTLTGTASGSSGRTVLRTRDFNLKAGTYTLSSTYGNIFVQEGSSIIANGNGAFTLSEDKNVYVGFNVSTGTVYDELISCQIEEGGTATSWSPYSNICPISGFTGVNVAVTGVNVWDEEWEQGYYDASGIPGPSLYAIRSKNYISVKPSTTYYIHNGFDSNGRLQFYDVNKNWIGTSTGTNRSFTTADNCYFIKFSTATTYGGTYNNDISINYPSTDTSYHAYNGHVYPISWQNEAGIVYGGYIDLVSGVLTVTKVGIAEYNGEALPSAWISDRDRYVAGSAPTIGAQVVYDLATPQTYQLTPQQINTLIGQNNVWNNTNGQTEVEYFIPIE